MNKKMKRYLELHKNSTDTELYHVYNNFSTAKQNAFNYCKELCYQYKGKDLKILSNNSFVFTAGFIFTDQKTGVLSFMVITPTDNITVDYE